MKSTKGRRLMAGMSFIEPSYIQEGEFETMYHTEKQPVKRHGRKLAAVLLAACLVFTLAATAYAADLFGLKDLFRTPSQELPREAEPYIQKETVSAEAEDWSCEITESLSDNTTVMATVTIRGGDKYIIAPTDAGPADSVGVIGLPGDQTLEQYAKEHEKTLLLVGASIKEIGGQETSSGSQRMENRSDSEMVILTQTSKPASASGTEAVCVVYALEAGGSDVQRVSLPFTLGEAPTVGGEMVYHPQIPDAIPGMKVGDMTITETPLGYNIRMMETVTDEEAYHNIMKVTMDGLTYGEGGSVLESDGNYYFQASMCQGTLGDVLIVRYYDWDKEPIGEILFKK